MTVNELAIASKTDSEYIKPLWLAVYRLISVWANKRIRAANNPRYDADDLIQAGYFALIKAVGQYPADSPYKFTTYLHYHCRSEFAAVQDIRSSKREPYLYSLDKTLTGTDDFAISDTLADESATDDILAVEDDIYNVQLHDALEKALDTLPEQQRYVLNARFYGNKTFKEISEILGCNATYPRDIERNALWAIRRSKAKRRLREFMYYDCAVKRTGYTAFREDMQSSVERVVLKKLELEERAGH